MTEPRGARAGNPRPPRRAPIRPQSQRSRAQGSLSYLYTRTIVGFTIILQ